MMHTIVGAFALFTLAAAQTVTRTPTATSSQPLPTGALTVSLYVPGADPQPIAASVISTAPSVTAYHINCPPGTDSTNCGLGLGANLTVSSSSIYQFVYTDGPLSIDYKCTVAASSAVCAQTSKGAAGPVSTTTETLSASLVTLLPVVVTAGAEKLTASASATASGNRTATSSGASRSGSASGAASSSSAANVPNVADFGRAMSFTGLLSVLLGLF